MPVTVCPICGYDARGLPSGVCPECGQRLPDVAPPAAPTFCWRLPWVGATVAATVGVAYVTTLLPGVPRWWGPLPITVVFPLFMMGSSLLAFVPVTTAAVLLSIPLVLGRVRVPWWTAIPMLGITALAWYYLAIGSRYGVKYQGTTYVVACGSFQSAFTTSLVAIWFINRRRRGYGLVVAWHLIAAVWLASYAFPYYGELP